MLNSLPKHSNLGVQHKTLNDTKILFDGQGLLPFPVLSNRLPLHFGRNGAFKETKNKRNDYHKVTKSKVMQDWIRRFTTQDWGMKISDLGEMEVKKSFNGKIL